jgi:thiamine biosynthesis protein ThiI
MDKSEITDEARRIGTFESARCPTRTAVSSYVPRSPPTAATREEVGRAEEALDVGALVEGAVRGAVEERFEFPDSRCGVDRRSGGTTIGPAKTRA